MYIFLITFKYWSTWPGSKYKFSSKRSLYFLSVRACTCVCARMCVFCCFTFCKLVLKQYPIFVYIWSENDFPFVNFTSSIRIEFSLGFQRWNDVWTISRMHSQWREFQKAGNTYFFFGVCDFLNWTNTKPPSQPPPPHHLHGINRERELFFTNSGTHEWTDGQTFFVIITKTRASKLSFVFFWSDKKKSLLR